ncbi:MAG: hypothetical protein NPIRA02_04480 [Nitrospirales bacterium]|nr:MAG: hypothetical protein NPIRA02_04480 [Nitrospirales bacterium]
MAREITEFPLIGRIVPEVGDENLRERFVYSYRLVYQLKQSSILVVAIIHGKRLLDQAGKRFEQ